MDCCILYYHKYSFGTQTLFGIVTCFDMRGFNLLSQINGSFLPCISVEVGWVTKPGFYYTEIMKLIKCQWIMWGRKNEKFPPVAEMVLFVGVTFAPSGCSVHRLTGQTASWAASDFPKYPEHQCDGQEPPAGLGSCRLPATALSSQGSYTNWLRIRGCSLLLGDTRYFLQWINSIFSNLLPLCYGSLIHVKWI